MMFKDFVKWVYNKEKEKYEFVNRDPSCQNCCFAEIDYSRYDFEVFERCSLSQKIQEGTSVCPYDVEKKG